MWSRRRFLTSSAALVGGAGLVSPRLAGATGSIAPIGPYHVLEIFLDGGLSWHEVAWLSATVADRDGQPNWPADHPWWSDLGVDEPVAWSFHGAPMGAATAPLDALQDRLRLVTQAHTLPAHEVAIPYAATGRTLGRADLFGTGAAAIDAGGRAYVLYPWSATRTVPYLTATGLFDAGCRPLALRYLPEALAEDVVAELAAPRLTALDRLRAGARDRYGARLVHPTGGSVRSQGFSAFDASADAAEGANELASLLVDAAGGDTPLAIPATETAADNTTRRALRLGAGLIAQHRAAGTSGVHVTVIDRGLTPYDTHVGASRAESHTTHAGNLWSVLDEVSALVASGAIDLDDTLVVVNTEFGRWNDKPTSNGTEHHPDGYAAALLGGPIGTVGTSGVAGSFDALGVADTATSPVDLRCAVLSALGIDPFSETGFGTSELSDPTVEDSLHATFFGAP